MSEVRVRLDLSVLGFAALVATFPLNSVNLVPLFRMGAAVDDLPRFSAAVFLAVLVSCLAMLATSRARTRECWLPGQKTLAVSACCGMLGYFVPLADAASRGWQATPFLMEGGAVVVSLATVPLCLFWAVRFTSFSMEDALVNLAACLAFEALFHVILMGVNAENALVLFLSLATIGYFAPFALRRTGRIEGGALPSSVCGEPYCDSSALDAHACPLLGEPRTARSFVTFAPLYVGLCILGFALTVDPDEVLLGSSPFAIGFLVGAVLVSLVMLCGIADPVGCLVRICIPVLALSLLLLHVFASALPFLAPLTQLMTFVIFGVVGIASLALFCGLNCPRRMATAILGAMAAFSAVSCIGVYLNDVVGLWDEVGSPLFAMSILHAAFMVAAPLFLSPGRPSSAVGRVSDDPEGHADKRLLRVEEAAARYRLTDREADILGYLARGYGAARIADKLTLAPSTVRTHCNNLYRKMGVNSKEDVLELLDDDADVIAGR